jgi:hypothetical protein
MAYIGVPPADRTSGARVRDEFTADGTQICFQLSQEVPGSFESNIIAVVENVIQEPVSAYTIVDTVTVALTSISGTFTKNETITGGTSAATGKVIQVNTGSVVIKVITGTFQAAEGITGGSSSATATISTLTTNIGRGLNFSGTPTNGSKIYALHQASATYNLKPAAGSVTPDSLSENLRTFTVDKFTATSSQTAFTLSTAPVSVKSILVFIDGVMQSETTHYTLSGVTLTIGASLTAGQQVSIVHLGFSTVSRTAFPDASITTAMLADGSITADKIANGTIIAADVADGAITTAKLNSTLDLSGKTITYRSIVAGDIADSAITTAKIAAGAVATVDIADAAVTASKMGTDAPVGVSDKANTATGYFALPSGTTGQRPGTPANGMIRYNSTTGFNEIYQNSGWQSIQNAYSTDYIIVAGGGGSSNEDGGGGGAGGYLASSLVVLGGTSYTVTVGAGGAGSPGGSYTAGNNGSNSVFGSFTAIGGGRGGGDSSTSPNSGGSGGGGYGAGAGSAISGGAGTAGQGNAGGTGFGRTSGSNEAAGGGGGAGAVGSNGASNVGGNGGIGIADTWTGSSRYLAGGGGGGGASTAGTGGSGGGGNGATTGTATSGTANTGGGGGGVGSNAAGTPGSGGSGIVIIRYIGSQRGTGGTVTSSGGYTLHTFTSSSTFTA